MPGYFIILAVFLLTITGCSSSGKRAPVSELTLAERQVTKKNNNKKRYTNDSTHYIVKKGDTLYGIAWQNNLDISTLAKLNNLHAPYTLHPGDRLTLAVKKAKAKKYIVKSGDTLSNIAWTNKVALSTLAKMNNLAPPYKIHPGDILHLQSQSTESKTKTVNKGSKIGDAPQKINKASCEDQKCKENSKQTLVQTKTKAYPEHKVSAKASKKNIKNKVKAKIRTWRWPTNGRLLKTFSSSQSGMKGISLSNKRGTPIYASAPGVVVYAGSALRGYGNLIIIKHNHDYLSAYAHNEKLLVKENENITEGQKIATMGDSGTENVHLHFEIRYRGKAVDPERYLPKR